MMARARKSNHPGRLRWILAGFVVVTLLWARPIFAADISGTWDISCWIGEEHQLITLDLLQEGSRLSGMGTLRTDETGEVVRVVVQSGTVGLRDLRFFDYRFSVVEMGRTVGSPQEFMGSWYRDEMSGRTIVALKPNKTSSGWGCRGARRTPLD